jgi:methionyl-tRNA synthetase
MSDKKHYFITTAIDYANSKPHIGHAYEKVTADIIARYKRLKGYEVYFSTGTDEHSLNVMAKAKETGVDPKAYVDNIAVAFKDLCTQYKITITDFVQTSEVRHAKAVSEIFRRCFETGDIYKGTYEGWYCKSCESFYAQGELTEDNCCPTHKSKADLIKEDNYFLKITKYTDKLLKHIEDNPDFIQPETRRNEILAMLKSGFRDVSVSRPGLNWGIPLPVDHTQTVYVWFDALINYATAAGFATDEEKFKKYWPADAHIIGKDITKFHCIIWPIMLMSAGLALPKKVFGHGFLLNKGEKMSKTRGNIVDPVNIANVFGVDVIRYYFAANITNGSDGEFSEDSIILCYNTDLANDLGNLINRSLNMVEKYCGAKVPQYYETILDDKMKAIVEQAKQLHKVYGERMDVFNLSGSLDAAWDLISMANKLIEDEAPWNLQKNNKIHELETVLYILLEVIRLVSIVILPVMPDTASRIWAKLGVNYDEKTIIIDEELHFGKLAKGGAVAKGDPLFPRILDEKEAEKLKALKEKTLK